jgi:hypothetical protein
MKFNTLALIAILSYVSEANVLKKRCAPKTAEVEGAEKAATPKSYTPPGGETAVEAEEEEVEEEVEAVEAPAPEVYAAPRKAPGISRAPTSKVIESNLKGDTTHFDDNEYQCYEWSFRAKNAMLQGFKFAATNFQLCSPEKEGDYKLECGGPQYKCARTSAGEEYIIIDWCNPDGAESCTVAEPGHLDILVAQESNNVDCVDGCEGYNSFKATNTAWELVECSFQINAGDFEKATSYQGDGSEYGK